MEYLDFLQLDYIRTIVMPFCIALGCVWVIFPHLVRIARMKGIVDNPNARKLQKEPVPVLGGVAVFFGIFMSLSITNYMTDCSELFVPLTSMLLMLYLGTMDDILNLRATTRMIIQIGAVLVLITIGKGYTLDNLLGLWGGVYEIPHWIAVPLTVFAAVGIINATNLIDGVDGLSSGFGTMASLIFSVAFLYTGDYPMVILCASTAGALTLFFFHNVFGQKMKMFIGDGGTLVLGVVLASYVLRLIHSIQQIGPDRIIDRPASVIPFTLAVLSIPVFDTLRVMTARILKHMSPFHPDKTHLHHMFIGLGFSHIVTTVSILSLNSLIVAIWALTYLNGASADVQTAVVILSGLAATAGLYCSVDYFERRYPARYERIADSIRSRQPQRTEGWLRFQSFIDRRYIPVIIPDSEPEQAPAAAEKR